MNYRKLGNSGLFVSELSMGAFVTFGRQVKVDSAANLMKTAYDAGVNFFDNAESYEFGEAERVMGAALKKLGWRRDSYLVSSKVHGGCIQNPKPNQWGLSRKHIFEACDQALERLGIDYLDLYFCHDADPRVPMEETVRAMNELIQRGKILYWGTSEWSAQQIMEAHMIARQYNLTPPTMEQPQYNLFERYRFEVEYVRLYRTIGLGTTTWAPLASGVLTGKYNDGIPAGSRASLKGYEWLLPDMLSSDIGKERVEKTKKLMSIAEKMDIPMATLAIAWCLKNSNVSTVILGASKASQLEENLIAGEKVIQLTDEIMEDIEKILENKPEPMEFQFED